MDIGTMSRIRSIRPRSAMMAAGGTVESIYYNLNETLIQNISALLK